jgi:hypothetical protein
VAARPERKKLSDAQVALMREVLAGAPATVIEAAERIGRGEVVSDGDAEAVVDTLTAGMLSQGYDGDELTTRARQIDGIIGVAQQRAQSFYD